MICYAGAQRQSLATREVVVLCGAARSPQGHYCFTEKAANLFDSLLGTFQQRLLGRVSSRSWLEARALFHVPAIICHHQGSFLGQKCQGQAQEITVEVILCKYSRQT